MVVLIDILSIAAMIGMILLIILHPTLKIGKFHFSTFCFPLLLVALVFLIFPVFDKSELKEALFTNTPINPLKILVLFLSISVLSIGLDKSGFFSTLASWSIKKFHDSQYALFFSLYLFISITTIFTSNDIVILTFTPFIIYLSKEGKFNPLPYLVMEFVAGNTFSMLLQIGNPTNIYLSTAFGVDFAKYFEVMAVPTLIIGAFSIAILLLIFHKSLSKPIEHFDLEVKKVEDPFLMYVSLIHLGLAIICLAISNVINIEMWLITLGFAVSMSVILIVYSIVKKKNEVGLIYKKLPYSLVPFILSMFVIIMAEDGTGLFGYLASFLNGIENPILQGWAYLTSSTLACNFVNNIPMSLMYSRILDGNLVSVFSTIIGSNLGALLTPIGALAGIMWMGILKHKGVHFSFGQFIKYGAVITGFMLVGALGAVALIPFFI
ncbi:MAG: hypothetical protein K6G74_02855 [Bacilli bacterium]|nr:hypothetical protein [Bacilli bacterium]